MPHSLVLNLIPQGNIPTKFLTGRHHHALFLDLVKSVDPKLAGLLHGQTTDKAFALSVLQTPHRDRNLLQWQHDRSISAGTPCWWRISLLDDSLFSKLAHLWLSIDPHQPWHIGQVGLQMVSVISTPQSDRDWASFSTYQQLYAQASSTERQIQFSFYTPTTFRVSKYDCAMPTKETVFNSLLKRWNLYSNIPFPKEIIEPIYPSFFNIRTEIAIDSRSKLIGCVGDITFQILGNVDPETIQQINTLADFALYAGVGRKTPMGMGMVRRRQPRDLQSRVQSLGVDPEQPTLAELGELVREYRQEH
jgi:CRISPR-associated endoribonuclease Cas6